MTDDLLKRLLQPPFGTETSERNLMAEAAAQLEAAKDGWAESVDLTRLARQQYGEAKYQLDASERRLESLRKYLFTAKAAGRADGLREAADVVWGDTQNLDTWTRKFVRNALIALIPTTGEKP